MSVSLSLGDGRMDPPFAPAVLCGNLVATCKQDRRPWIWIYPWISTQKSVDMDIYMVGNFISTASLQFFDIKNHSP